MKTKAVRLYGAEDLRLEEFELPPITDDEILVKVITDSICMSTYKLLKQGIKHKRCPKDIDKNPIIVGHEFAGDIIEVGEKWRKEFKAGEKFAIQPALNYKGSPATLGYSYQFCGGDSLYAIMPNEVMETGSLLHYNGDSYFNASLAEPMSCIISAYRAAYHNGSNYTHIMGIKEGGSILILGGAGPMGLGVIEYPLSLPKKPSRIVVTDVNSERLERAANLITKEYAKSKGIELIYVNSAKSKDIYQELLDLTKGNGYDDIFVLAAIKEVAELGDRLLSFDGCLNFFAGPSDSNFKAEINLYNCHYASSHILGTSGATTEDLKEALSLSAQGLIRPSVMISHIGGLDCVIETTKNLVKNPGGKKLIYPQINMPLTALADFEKLGEKEPLFKELSQICLRHNGLWNSEAEKKLLKYYKVS